MNLERAFSTNAAPWAKHLWLWSVNIRDAAALVAARPRCLSRRAAFLATCSFTGSRRKKEQKQNLWRTVRHSTTNAVGTCIRSEILEISAWTSSRQRDRFSLRRCTSPEEQCLQSSPSSFHMTSRPPLQLHQCGPSHDLLASLGGTYPKHPFSKSEMAAPAQTGLIKAFVGLPRLWGTWRYSRCPGQVPKASTVFSTKHPFLRHRLKEETKTGIQYVKNSRLLPSFWSMLCNGCYQSLQKKSFRSSSNSSAWLSFSSSPVMLPIAAKSSIGRHWHDKLLDTDQVKGDSKKSILPYSAKNEDNACFAASSSKGFDSHLQHLKAVQLGSAWNIECLAWGNWCGQVWISNKQQVSTNPMHCPHIACIWICCPKRCECSWWKTLFTSCKQKVVQHTSSFVTSKVVNQQRQPPTNTTQLQVPTFCGIIWKTTALKQTVFQHLLRFSRSKSGTPSTPIFSSFLCTARNSRFPHNSLQPARNSSCSMSNAESAMGLWNPNRFSFLCPGYTRQELHHVE